MSETAEQLAADSIASGKAYLNGQRTTASLDEVLGDVEAALTRYVHFPSRHGPVAMTLFVAETHAQDAFDVAPYIVGSSPVKRSGKSRLQEVCEHLVREPLRTSNVSPAFLFRNMAGWTLLFDEVDAIFRMRSDRNEELAGMLNAGWRRGAGAGRMDRQVGGAMVAVTYDAFGPKLLCGIGRKIPKTILDRAVPIRLERKGRSDVVARFRLRSAVAELTPLRERLAAWARGAVEGLRAAEPHLPDELNDRAQDVWEPLLAVAEAAGGDWPRRAWAAAIALHGRASSRTSPEASPCSRTSGRSSACARASTESARRTSSTISAPSTMRPGPTRTCRRTGSPRC